MKNYILPVVWLMGAVWLLTGYGMANEVAFEKHVLSPDFLSEGAAVADVNKDGVSDIVAGSYWFEGPDWQPHAFRPVKTYAPDTDYSDTFFNHAMDVNRDGWVDILRIALPGGGLYWYENPQGAQGQWAMRSAHPSVNNESPRFVDIDGDGRDDILFSDGEREQMVWLHPPETAGDTVWTRHAISEEGAPGTSRFSHGLGLGDVNNDGRDDVIVREGWWHAPHDPTTDGWVFREANLGEPAAQMYAYDVDADGDNDVVASSAHEYGIWWYEQRQNAGGNVEWVRHLIHDGFSQSHGLVLRDVNGDGLPDLVTGKRYFAHNGKDPGSHEPAVLYWFEMTREDGTPQWIPHRIDDDSGVGVELIVEDVTGDGRPDIVTANKKGVFLFEQR
ncbi:MAG: VCBS repeat-containing protein [Bacteroidetes bacterium]|nr:VCBS repeat-containing protein [Bacteroidota bacterium]